ncbi:MAG: class I SAM-dependent methyltransferase [bacterium]|nr:class I SAM-dependent methyltransferase [bacterium]
MLKNNTSPYRPVESYLYDRVIAPAVVGMSEQLTGDFIDGIPKNASVLDVGCGGGHMAVKLASSRPDLGVTGLDLSPEQVQRAGKRSSEAGARAVFTQGSALSIPFEDSSFDVVYSIASIKHWPGPAAGVLECIRVLKEGGLLMIYEVDRYCSADEVQSFTDKWKLPKLFKPGARVFFKKIVAERSFAMEEMESMLAPLGCPFEVAAVPGTVGWHVRAEKPESSG